MTSPAKQRQRPGPELLELRRRMRHSASHLMADAVLEMFPEAHFAIGPPTEEGFYYDFDVPRPFTPEDLQRVEETMRRRIAADLPFAREVLSRQEARERFARQPFKLAIIDAIPEGEPLSVYRHGNFGDLCEGPHVASSGKVIAFKLLSVAGAYWRGDERNPMLQRIYGTAFESQALLDEHLKRLEEAQRRDHRKLGQELGLFLFHPIAPASPFFLPKGAALYNTLVDYVRGLYRQHGYQEVITPQIFDTELWKRSGHYQAYLESMYFTRVEEREFGIKPMNCPAHALIYAAQLHSYRDLPVRLADFGRLHRYERSGVTHGLTRVRTFSQDDAHIFCTPDQVANEVKAFVGLVQGTYHLFQIDDMRIAFSLRPDKRVGTEEMWDRAEGAMREVLKGLDLPHEEMPGEGAFYGPKIDFFVADALGREWQLGTIQLDYSLPERFELEYTAADGSRQRPVVLHRAMFGSIERFLGVLIEHFGGAFPVWIAPVQAVVVPIAERHVAYAEQVRATLHGAGLRVELDGRNERMQAKIRDAQLQKVPYMLVVGDREAAAGAVAVRLRSGEDKGALPLERVKELILEDVANGR
ncbi:MAG: threonine--tRNA ligase [Dehalococcoidia bacterium]|nr:threonine--tRNA ligase [Dehalococcoidia bacterium]